ncbi:DNA topoisomerase IV subunit A [Marinivivus vitaminiproducens]|uniref:DNA topoisomerase IV subunit A n=1 Tax=Marinivivus vitaminiproducens TaxID=3035935 RepID=UPI0027987F54|nr:DNA topoisomerase IV subunit A [Geminicoccaceae bacterium SCSIO 64248]
MAQPREAGEISPVDLKDALSERYLAYALSTITSRSLPDVRDGLKPVQRRLLYAMRQLRLDPGGGFKKCARVVGDVMGKFHPHGDSAIYEAMVRLAQEFAQRYPLVDGQGNFGNIDGDNAAAMRYTEARLTAVASALLDGIDQDTVDFRDTYDGNESEPVVLPAAFPNLLANGAAGIAVGMATSIPPHNAGEICQALLPLIDHAKARLKSADEPEVALDTILRVMPGPDFPTGGIIVEPREAMREFYATGRGGFRLRARWQVEQMPHGQYQVVIDQMPYQVPKARLIERVADLLTQRKLPLLQDIRDESAEDVRLILVPRARTVPAELLMESLFRATELETRFPLNMNVLDAAGVPRVMGLIEVLRAFLAHRMQVLERRSRFRLGKIDDRIEVLEGYIKAFLNLDEVIRIIRYEDEPKQELIRAFELTDRQAEAILNMRLRNLRKLEEMELRKELKALQSERRKLTSLLAKEDLRWDRLREETLGMISTFGGGEIGTRRTTFADAPVVAPAELEIPVERVPVTVVVSAQSWGRTIRGHIGDDTEVKFKEGDGPRFQLHAQSSDKLVITADDGRLYLLPVDRLPGGRGQGEPLGVHLELSEGARIVDVRVHRPDARLILATLQGRGFVAEEAAVAAQTRSGRQVVNLERDDRLAVVTPVEAEHVAVLGSNRKLLIFGLDELPVMTRGKGVLLQRNKDGHVADVRTLDPAKGLTWIAGMRNRREDDLSPWQGKRASAGRTVPTGFPRDGRIPR